MLVALAACGVLGLLLFAFGLLQIATRAARFDTTKAIADSSPDGVLVTDQESRILYANGAYRALSGAPAGGDLRSVERLFTGSPDVSESVYRLSQAAKSGGRASEELRLAPPPNGDRRRGLVSHSRASARGRGQARADGLDCIGRNPRTQPPRNLLPGSPARHRLSGSCSCRLFFGRARRRYRPYERNSRCLARLRSRPVRSRPAQGRRHYRRRRRRDAVVGVRPAGRSDDATVRRRSEASPRTRGSRAHLS